MIPKKPALGLDPREGYRFSEKIILQRAWPVLDNGMLPEPLRKRLRKQARDNVGASPPGHAKYNIELPFERANAASRAVPPPA
jgi:hypothetical protein